MKMDKTYACVPSLKVAFVGLGVMGFPMAGHLKLAGHGVCVYNRTTAKAEKWVETFGGRMAATPAEAARGAGIEQRGELPSSTPLSPAVRRAQRTGA